MLATKGNVSQIRTGGIDAKGIDTNGKSFDRYNIEIVRKINCINTENVTRNKQYTESNISSYGNESHDNKELNCSRKNFCSAVENVSNDFKSSVDQCSEVTKFGSINIDKTVANRDNVRTQIKKCERRFICEVCSKEFSKSSNFKSHLMIHSGEKPHACSFCDKRFPQRSRLKKHLRVHSGEKPHRCTVCQKCFSHSHQLRGHLRIHSGERPYICRLCGRTFTQSGHLKGHIKSHLGKEHLPYEDTSKLFSYAKSFRTDPFCQSYLVNQNSIDVARENSEKVEEQTVPVRFPCGLCEKTFSQLCNLKVHQRVHTKEKPFKCTDCDKAFAYSHGLTDHKRIHSGIRPYFCDFCDKSFTQIGNLQKHVRIHNGERPYACTKCDKSFRQLNHLKNHQGVHTLDDSFKCRLCDKTYKSSQALKSHKLCHTENTHSCHVCSKVFCNESSFKKHKCSVIDKKFSRVKKKKYKEKDVTLGEKDLFCDKIDEEHDDNVVKDDIIVVSEDRKSIESLRNGKKKIRKVVRKKGADKAENCQVDVIDKKEENVDNVCDRQLVKVEVLNVEEMLELKEVDLVVKEEVEECDTYSIVSDNFDVKSTEGLDESSDDEPIARKKSKGSVAVKYSLAQKGSVSDVRSIVRENVQDSGEKLVIKEKIEKRDVVKKNRSQKGCYLCSICNKTYPYKYTLKSHMKIHSEHRDYVCEICGRSFVYAHNLEDHKRTHSGEKPFECSHCEKRFTQLNHLQKHVRTHTGERPFSCEICGRLFSQSKSFKAHHRSHTGEKKPYGCLICDKKFSQKVSLKNHIENHAKKDVPLSVVEASLVMQSARLKQNGYMSKGANGFYCDLCNRSFTKVGYFKIHMRVHTGDKPYSCSKCDYKCTQSSSLKRHMKVHGDFEVTIKPD